MVLNYSTKDFLFAYAARRRQGRERKIRKEGEDRKEREGKDLLFAHDASMLWWWPKKKRKGRRR